MSRNVNRARSAIARPSQLLSPDGVWKRYIVGPPPVPSSRERHVVSALDHARAAALAEQALHRDGDVQVRSRAPRMQRREEAGAAGAEDEDVGLESLQVRCAATGILRRTSCITSAATASP